MPSLPPFPKPLLPWQGLLRLTMLSLPSLQPLVILPSLPLSLRSFDSAKTIAGSRVAVWIDGWNCLHGQWWFPACSEFATFSNGAPTNHAWVHSFNRAKRRRISQRNSRSFCWAQRTDTDSLFASPHNNASKTVPR